MKTILLTNDLTAKCWIATELIDGKANPELINLFGTHKLPTSFTNQASGKIVYTEVQRLNPTAKVILIIE